VPSLVTSWESATKNVVFVHKFTVETEHTVDGCEILHQLMVYPNIYSIGFHPFGGAGFRNHPQYQQLYLLEFDRWVGYSNKPS